MSGFCYYCGKAAHRKGRLLHTDEPVWLCDYHHEQVGNVQRGRNAGAGAGIG
jgi:hypothetical protein